jgi:hypothetical protein
MRNFKAFIALVATGPVVGKPPLVTVDKIKWYMVLESFNNISISFLITLKYEGIIRCICYRFNNSS